MKSWKLPRLGDSIRVRLAVWHTVTVAALLGAFAAGTWKFFAHTTRVRADESLAETTRAFVKAWKDEGEEDQATTATAAAAAAAAEVRYPDRRVLVFDRAGHLVAVSDTVPLTPALTRQALANPRAGPVAALVRGDRPQRAAFTTLDGMGQDAPPVRALVSRATYAGEPFTVLALRSLRAEDEASEAFVSALAIVIPIVLLLAGVGGYLLARASLAPVVAMGRQAERISASTLDERLPVANPRDELGGLAGVLNGLLARLEHAFEQQQRSAEQQRQFMADASHELRTPVAALCSVADVTLARRDRDPAELMEALDVVRGEGRRLGRLVEDLLLLARADAGQLPVHPALLFLEDLLHDCARAARGLAAARGITLVAPPADEAPFVGDAQLLRRLVMILLDNAIKYTPPGGLVRLSLDRSDAGTGARYTIAVEDTGPGVPPAGRERIFERFFRADLSRSRGDEGGTGLGLAIGRWIAEAQGGTLHLDATGPTGSRFVITLPMPTGTATASQAEAGGAPTVEDELQAEPRTDR
jgi:signal transduction histidine kinase